MKISGNLSQIQTNERSFRIIIRIWTSLNVEQLLIVRWLPIIRVKISSLKGEVLLIGYY